MCSPRLRGHLSVLRRKCRCVPQPQSRRSEAKPHWLFKGLMRAPLGQQRLRPGAFGLREFARHMAIGGWADSRSVGQILLQSDKVRLGDHWQGCGRR